VEILDEEGAGSAHVQVVTGKHLCNNTSAISDSFFLVTAKNYSRQ
jgi:hypothetical protein